MRQPDDRLSVSVIVPCHNGEAFLAAALESILGQDPVPDEVILIDDGSTDATPEIAARYGPRVRYHRQAQRGAGAARNAGVRLATGNCIAFLDADDLWPAGSLGIRFATLQADARIACVTGLIEHFATDQSGAARPDRHLPGVQPMRHLAAMLIRRSVFDHIGLLDETGRLGEAFEWVARLSDSGLPMVTLDHVVLRRRVHDRNTGVLRRGQRKDYLHVLKGVIDRRRAEARSAAAEPFVEAD